MDAVHFYDRVGKVLVAYNVRDVPKRVFAAINLEQNGLAELSSSQLVLWHNLQHMTLCVVFGAAESPLRVENFVNFFLECLKGYLTSVSLAQIEQNAAQVLSILDTVLDDGHQVMDEPSIVCALVPSVAPSVEIEYELWRPKGAKHVNQEIFIDVEESLRVERTSNSRAKPIVCLAQGRVNVLSKLSDEGVIQPRVTIDFALERARVTLHKSVQSQLPHLNFVPADGTSTVAEYSAPLDKFELVSCRLTTGLGLDKNEFEVHLMVSMDTIVKQIENFKVKAVVPGAKTIKENRLTAGEVSNNHKTPGEFVWSFSDAIPVGWEATLRGVAIGASAGTNEAQAPAVAPAFPTFVHATFDFLGRVPSRAQVKSVQVPGKKVYKGVRYRTSVDLVVRP